MYKVYLVTNKLNNKKYVGFTSQVLSDRWAKHKTRTAKSKLKAAVDTYGAENFSIEVLSEHDDLIDAMIEELVQIRNNNSNYPNGYNNLYTKNSNRAIANSQKGISKSAKHKKAVSKGLTGLKQSDKTVAKRVEKLYKPIEDQYGNIYTSVKEASILLNIPIPSISHILVGRVTNPKHGYIFKYIG